MKFWLILWACSVLRMRKIPLAMNKRAFSCRLMDQFQIPEVYPKSKIQITDQGASELLNQDTSTIT
jgi:hypothetical protein